jgi:hypothetical protein
MKNNNHKVAEFFSFKTIYFKDEQAEKHREPIV